MKVLVIALVALVGSVQSRPGNEYYTKYGYVTSPPNTPRPHSDCKDYDNFESSYKNSCEYGSYHVYEKDCTCFIQCVGSTPHLMPCATGTVWSQHLLTCVHGSECPTPPPPTPYYHPTTSAPPKCKDEYYYSNKESCAGYYNDYKSYPHDCSCYYQCDAGNKWIAKPCPPGTVWDNSQRTCVRPCPGTCTGRHNLVAIIPAFCPGYYRDEEFQDEAQDVAQDEDQDVAQDVAQDEDQDETQDETQDDVEE